MGTTTMLHPIDDDAKTLILQKAHQLSKFAKRVRVDKEDIVSELTLGLVRCRSKYDPQRGTWPAFVRVVITHDGIDLQRKWAQEQKTATLHFSDSIVHAAILCASEQDRLRHRGVDFDSGREDLDLAHDLTHVLLSLTEEDQTLCELLSQTTTAEAAQRLGRSRSYVHKRKRVIRRRLAPLVRNKS